MLDQKYPKYRLIIIFKYRNLGVHVTKKGETVILFTDNNNYYSKFEEVGTD